MLIQLEERKPVTVFDIKNENSPIFVKRGKEKLVGMIVKDDDGWIIRIGGGMGALGWSETLDKCLSDGLKCGFTYFQESA